MPQFPNTHVKSLTKWTNYPGTLPEQAINLFCAPDDIDDIAPDDALAPQGASVRAIVKHCFDQQEPLRVIGSRFSFSTIIQPARVALDPPTLDAIFRAPQTMLRAEYLARSPQNTPAYVQAGAEVSSINRRLARVGLALQTSGAGDGHRIAGCIATGTHGGALDVGAVHDTVLAMHVLVDPDKALFIQSASEPVFDSTYVDWLVKKTGLPTELVSDDELFAAVQVSLGSLGMVFGIVLDTVPLYVLRRRIVPMRSTDARITTLLDTLDTTPLVPGARPYHLDVLMNPYPSAHDNGAYATLCWKEPGNGVSPTYPDPVPPDLGSDTMGFIARLAHAIDGHVTAPLTTLVLQQFIASQLVSRSVGDGTVSLPGMLFGPTTLPPGQGASTEIVVDARDARRTYEVITSVVAKRADHGQHLLGAMALRFVRETKALLGMNINPMNCYIELPSIRNSDVLAVYKACWDELEANQIPFTCHWGQLHGLTAARTRAYFGARVDRWKAARNQLLGDVGRKVFAAPILREVGLAAP